MNLDLDYANVNSLWGGVLVETLARLGVQYAVISPGSRSTPLTFAFARHRAIEAIPVLDERSAAFFALGLARRTRRPVVLLCTSGTAGANYFPAVIEAQESGVPLLVITADRPPEMRDCGSGQTIDQQKLFGAHVNFFHELAVPVASVSMLAYLRQTVANAFERTQIPAAGPVHLNAPFRDPLPPVTDGSADGLREKLDEQFFSALSTPRLVASQSTVWQRPTTARGLIVAGPAAPEDPAHYSRAVLKLSADLGWPVLADALSPLRSYAEEGSGVVTTYDAILRDPTLARELTPRTVLCVGSWPTSKVLRSWLETFGGEVLLVAPFAANRDALHGRTRQIVAPVESIAVAGERIADASYVSAWKRADVAARSLLDRTLEAEKNTFEPKAAWILAQKLPVEVSLFVASSMPVRDLEYVWPANGRCHAIYFNRGANGIDGTLSTALGLAHGGRPTVLLTGDLALLHDSNGFLISPKFEGSLTIVLINNGGGGIFEHLPVAEFQPTFEEFFATPQAVDFEKLCAAHGVDHVRVNNWNHFADLVSALPAAGIRVLEISTDRKRDAAQRKKLFGAMAAAARDAR
ncbi:MAG: 2-succinyl-5-enolpyruvyl-6-hydroxy-3-cyclohexene-1-carboxylic-acid synthase [Opitutus sp.]